MTANYTIGGGEIVRSEFANGENNFHFTDALGSVTALAGTNGSLTARNEYDAFGLQSSSSQTANSIGYTGQRLDKETGLMALGNGERYYSPDYARFIQQDSFAGNPQIPQSLNRFAYAHNNPNKYTDPSGNEPVTLIVLGLIAIGLTLLAANTNTQHAANNLEAEEKGWAEDDPRRSWGTAFSQANGSGKVINAIIGQDAYNGRQLSTGERVWQGITGSIEVIGNALLIGGVVFKAGGLIINAARGGTELLGISRGAWESIKNYEPFIEDAAGVLKAVKNPFQTIKAGWNATTNAVQAGWTATKEFFKDGVGETTKQTAKRAWEFTKERLNPFNYERDGANINFAGKSGELTRGVNGVGRQSADDILDTKQIDFVKKEFETIGGDTKILRFNEGNYTGYLDKKDVINIRGDIFPNTLSNHPNSMMSVRAALAHELGHRNFRGTSVIPGSWNDEFRASYWASKNVPNLSLEDKYMLVSDAVQRIREARPIVPFEPNNISSRTKLTHSKV